jgi:hypothetical protein
VEILFFQANQHFKTKLIFCKFNPLKPKLEKILQLSEKDQNLDQRKPAKLQKLF